MPLTYQDVMSTPVSAPQFTIPQNLLDFLRGAMQTATQSAQAIRQTPTADVTAQIAGQQALQGQASQQALEMLRAQALEQWRQQAQQANMAGLMQQLAQMQNQRNIPFNLPGIMDWAGTVGAVHPGANIPRTR